MEIVLLAIGTAVLSGVFQEVAQRTAGHVWDKLARRFKRNG